MKRKHQGCNSDNVVVAQMQISVVFEILYPKIADKIFITGAFKTSGINKYAMNPKDKGVESLSCIIKISEPVIIQLSTGKIQEQTHKKHSVTGTIKPKQLLEDVVLKLSVSQPLFAQFQVLSKENEICFKFENPIKLH